MSSTLEKPVRDLRKQQEVLAALGRRATASSNPVGQLQDTASLLAETFDADGSGTAEHSPDGRSLRLKWTPRDSDSHASDENATVEATDSLADFAIAQGRPIVVPDLAAEQRFADAFLEGLGVRSVLAVPLSVRGRSLGVLLAGSRMTDRFEEEDAAFGETIGHLVAATIARCRAEAMLAEGHKLSEETPEEPAAAEPVAAEPVAAEPVAESKPDEAFRPMPIPANAERRKRARRAYPYKQRIGEVFGGVLPDRDEFCLVQCNDIAAGGFSFLCTTLPQSKTLVVELGMPPKTSYLMAEVAHSTRFEQDGKRVYMVGCHYTGRAVYPDDE